jgi:Lon protease-like protein
MTSCRQRLRFWISAKDILGYIEPVKVPEQVPVMTLPNATLFPQALLPIFIFEPRYRRMLTDALESHRMFCVAMQRQGTSREIPLPVAGVGMIRVCVGHKDGTSHLILQGLARVELEETVRYKPYRVQRIRTLSTPPCDSVAADALMSKVRELIEERFKLGLPFPFLTKPEKQNTEIPPPVSAKDVISYLDSIPTAEQAADLVSCAVLPGARERQAILEALDVETRLRRLIQFMMREIRIHRKGRHE